MDPPELLTEDDFISETEDDFIPEVLTADDFNEGILFLLKQD